MWTKESNIINISGYKTDNLIIICSPEEILKCNINTNTNKLTISVFSLSSLFLVNRFSEDGTIRLSEDETLRLVENEIL